MLHRQEVSSGYMSMELQTVFHAIIRVVNYIKNSPLRGRHFAKLCDGASFEAFMAVVNQVEVFSVASQPRRHQPELCNNTDAEHMVLLYCCETHCLCHAEVLHSEYELKEETEIFLTIVITVMVQIHVTMKTLLRNWPTW
jgi:hypothetical protein